MSVINRSESKYFATAARMDEAFLKLIEKKDFAYITIKEICEVAGVNRSTFYLHYENTGDLLAECKEYMSRRFVDYMDRDSGSFIAKLKECTPDELYLITPEYLMPYLNFIKENQRLFRTGLENAALFGLDHSYASLLSHVITPILDRYGVPGDDRGYIMTFYINGLMAIISYWLKTDCHDTIEHVIDMMVQCVKPRKEVQ